MKFLNCVFISIFLLFLFFINEDSDDKGKNMYCNSVEISYYDTSNTLKAVKMSANPTMSTYFKNLNECHGRNIGGSCGYIAMGMLLSYYDTFYDDSFIADNFEYQKLPQSLAQLTTESPGVKKEPMYYTNSYSALTSFYINNSNQYFMSYLISMCMNNPVNYYNDYYEQTGILDLSKVCGLDYGVIDNILNYYLLIRGLSSSYYVDNETVDFDYLSYPQSNYYVKNFIVDMLDKGYPVLVCTEDTNALEGHAQVVHSYTFNNGIYSFYANMGWENGSTNCMIDSYAITEAYAIIPNNNTSATGSDNYSLFLSDEDNELILDDLEISIISNTQNMWEQYFGYTNYFNFSNHTLQLNTLNLSVNKIYSISFYGLSPQTFYIATSESYDTVFTGTNIITNDYYLMIFDDINSDEESDYYDPNAWARFSINTRLTNIFSASFIINQPYYYFDVTIRDYLYAY